MSIANLAVVMGIIDLEKTLYLQRLVMRQKVAIVFMSLSLSSILLVAFASIAKPSNTNQKSTSKGIVAYASCLNQTSKDEISKYISIEDIKEICVALEGEYKKFNNLLSGRLAQNLHINLVEVIQLDLVSPELYNKNSKKFSLLATQIERSYRRVPGQKLEENNLYLQGQMTTRAVVVATKEDGQWRISTSLNPGY
jgi:hypothetical protein